MFSSQSIILEENHFHILKAVENYAEAYRVLESVQLNNLDELPKGDQKTGVVGEFIAKHLLKKIYPSSEIKLADNHSQKGYDILIDNKDKIQVKTISAYSKTGITTPIKTKDEKNKPIDGIVFIRLNKDMLSGEYLYVNRKNEHDNPVILEVFVDGKKVNVHSLFKKYPNLVKPFQLCLKEN